MHNSIFGAILEFYAIENQIVEEVKLTEQGRLRHFMLPHSFLDEANYGCIAEIQFHVFLFESLEMADMLRLNQSLIDNLIVITFGFRSLLIV